MLAERFFLLLAALLLTVALYWLWRVLSAYRLARRARQGLPPELATLAPAGRPVLLYFTTPDCVQCRLRQAPILEQLGALAQGTKRELSILTLDAIQYDALARFFGIMTVPTTIWLDAECRPVAVNHGLATLDQLRRQLFAVCGA